MKNKAQSPAHTHTHSREGSATGQVCVSVRAMSSLAVFLKNVPAWFLCGGVFLPVAVLLLLLIIHLTLNQDQDGSFSCYRPSESLKDHSALFGVCHWYL
uniref:Uncharacterized protein n=1 Tax=Pygocentrus nattereri TaxID=42514 RepID=A0A3B4DZF0_PYGNA